MEPPPSRQDIWTRNNSRPRGDGRGDIQGKANVTAGDEKAVSGFPLIRKPPNTTVFKAAKTSESAVKATKLARLFPGLTSTKERAAAAEATERLRGHSRRLAAETARRTTEAR